MCGGPTHCMDEHRASLWIPVASPCLSYLGTIVEQWTAWVFAFGSWKESFETGEGIFCVPVEKALVCFELLYSVSKAIWVL